MPRDAEGNEWTDVRVDLSQSDYLVLVRIAEAMERIADALETKGGEVNGRA